MREVFSQLKWGFPTVSQWQKLISVLSPKERVGLTVLSLLLVASFGYLIQTLYTRNTEQAPARGGVLIEGIVGHPRFLNPIYADASDVDRDLANLLYAGLFTFTAEGEIIPDLVQDWKVEAEGRIYEITIKEQARWHDGYPVRADDVVFTIETIKNPKYKSPLQANWIGVEVEKISDERVKFILQDPYAPFLERLTVKILPAHLWGEVGPENFPLSVYNLKPIGSGPYQIARIQQDQASGAIKEIVLSANYSYHREIPYITGLHFRFFATEQELLAAVQRGTVQSFSVQPSHAEFKRLSSGRAVYSFSMPRYFALFFNLTKEPGKNAQLREALALGTNKQAIAQVAGETGRPVESLLLPDLFGLNSEGTSSDPEEARKRVAELNQKNRTAGTFQSDLRSGSSGTEVRLLQECLAKDPEVYPEGTVSGLFGPQTERAVKRFQEKYAQDILAPAGFTRGTGIAAAGTRAKLNEVCFPQEQTDRITLSLSYPANSHFQRVAENIQAQWEALGLAVELKSYPADDFERTVLRPRDFEVLLFGEILGMTPDPFPFWHSSQKIAPGLNLSSYENKKTDSLLVDIRREMHETTRREKMEELQEILQEDIPAIPLYDIPYTYILPRQVQGVGEHRVADPSRRFDGISEWYIETKREWK